MKRLFNNRRLLLFLISTAIFAWIVTYLKLEKTFWFDDMTLTVTEQTLLFEVFTVITWFGSKWGIISISLVAMIGLWWIKRNYSAILLIIIGVLGGDFVNKWLKHFIGRERPLPTEEGFSFPSGHAMVGLILYGFLCYLIYHEKQTYNWLSYIMILTIILVGISRVILGVHYVSDVIGGFAIGGVILIGLISIYDILLMRTPSIIRKEKSVSG